MNTCKAIRFVLLTLLSFGMCPAVRAANFYTIGNATGPEFSVSGVSLDGSTVIGDQLFTGQAYRWTAAGGATLIGAGSADGVSGDGSVIVGKANNLPVLWTQATGFQPLSNTPGGAWDISADGKTVVGYFDLAPQNPDHDYEPFRWTSTGGFTSLVPPDPNSNLMATHVSGDGSVILGSPLYAGVPSFRWTESTGAVNLGSFAGGPMTPTNVSADGNVIVGSIDTQYGQAFRLTSSGPSLLGKMPGQTGGSVAYATSADGSVIVGSAGGPTGGADAFIWNAADGTRELRSVLINDYGLGAQLANVYLIDAVGISGNGEVIAGNAFIGGQRVGYVVVLPEPATWTMAAAALVVIMLLAHKRRTLFLGRPIESTETPER
ncbi:MAG TPA: hypothetical protein VGN12_18020 [Pirellulales bacterium]